MTRLLSLTACVLASSLLALSLRADDPPRKLTPEERKGLEAKWNELTVAGFRAYQTGRYPDAVKALEEALKLARQLYPESEFPDGHAALAQSLNNLGAVYTSRGKYAEAEVLYKDALEMRKRLFKGDHLDVATSLNNLAALYDAWGKDAEAERLYKDALEMLKRLHKGDHPNVATTLNNLGALYDVQGRWAEAERLYTSALEMRKRLFKGDHPNLAGSMNNLGVLYETQGKFAEAEVLYRDALEMRKRLFKGDHPEVANTLNNLGLLAASRAKYADAEAFYKDALEMRKRLFKGDHPGVAQSLNNLGALYRSQGKYAGAEGLYKEALDMSKRLFKGDHPELVHGLINLANLYRNQGKYADATMFSKDALDMSERLHKGDHPELARSLDTLGSVYATRGEFAEAETLLKRALAMRKRLHKGDHPDVDISLNNLGLLYDTQGKYADAEPLYKAALEMSKRLHKGDHHSVATSLNNLGVLYWSQGQDAAAEPLFESAVEMSRRLTVAYAERASEGEALNWAASTPLYRDALLSLVRRRAIEPARTSDRANAYPVLWATKGTVARVFEQRQLQARAAATDRTLTTTLADLATLRRRRAELLLAPMTKDPTTLEQRETDARTLDESIARMNKLLAERLPALARAKKLNDATLTQLQRALPADAAVADFFRYTFFEFNNDRRAGQKETRTTRYLAFVVTRDNVAWVDLDTAAVIEPAVSAWRAAITSGKEIPDAIPKKVRELVWDKVRQELPRGIKTVYLCPDADLCRVPFAAIPGDKPGTVLLEDFSLATIPHAPFLLDKLWPQDPSKNSPNSALVVGGVKYDAELPAAPHPNPDTSRGDPLLKPGAGLGWSFLGNTVGEANGVADAAQRKKLNTTRLDGDAATTAAVLATLPGAKFAHFATHGFFADPSFRGLFQLDERDYLQRGGERIGRAVHSPLVMTGLVFAGANKPNTPGRGILTGEQLIDLDLSGLELAVLSACETGLGDVAGGEGTFGLQRAFHYAGTRNVVASLYAVPDAPTAALMGLFYRNLWEQNRTPMEALRQAQLEIYRNPDKIPELAKGFRGTFKVVSGTEGEVEIKPTKDGKAHPLLWAAFSLSGPGQ